MGTFSNLPNSKTELEQDLVRRGRNHYQVWRLLVESSFWVVDISHAGLSDKEIEDRVTSLVRTEL